MDCLLMILNLGAEMINCSLQQLNFSLVDNALKFGLKCIHVLTFCLDFSYPEGRMKKTLGPKFSHALLEKFHSCTCSFS